MSGIGSQHNKFDTCYGCPDRSADPNCHDTCRGYLYRQAEGERQNEQRRESYEYFDYRDGVITKAQRNAKRKKRK